MMQSYSNQLDTLFVSGNPVFMAHTYFGDPSEEFSLRLIDSMTKNGVDIIEFGIPFSDPTSDGPVFQRACKRALEAGMTPRRAIQGIERIRDMGIIAPVVVTSYYNIIHRMGARDFIEQIAVSGANGVIVPNLPLEECSYVYEITREFDIHLIQIVSPSTSTARLNGILQVCQGFVYVTAVSGVTGTRDNVQTGTLGLVRRVKELSSIPVLVGFGISSENHAQALVEAGADGVIVGSAICKMYEGCLHDPFVSLNKIQEFVSAVKHGCVHGMNRR